MQAFDTLKARKLLRESGFEETQVEAVVATVRDAFGENVATKQDVAESRTELQQETAALRTEVKQDIAALRAEVKQDIAELRTDISRMGMVLSVGIVGLTVTLIKLL